MEIVPTSIEGYMLSLSQFEDSVLSEMEEKATKRNFPIVGPLVGRVLYQLTRMSGAHRILDLGSGFGYSAYWMALAMRETDEIILTEYSAENLEEARDSFRRGEIHCQTQFQQGDALEIMDRLEGPFDIVFNDVDKELYLEVLDKIPALVGSGGLFICDNVFWHGKVLESDPDEATLTVLGFNSALFESSHFFSSILPLRDGVSVSLKR